MVVKGNKTVPLAERRPTGKRVHGIMHTVNVITIHNL